MEKFPGFPEGKLRMTPIPAPFFSQLLPQIDDLGELKLTLYTFWRLDRMEGSFRYLREEDYASDELLARGLGATQEAARVALQKALERAVARGTLLEADLELEGRAQSLYFLNTPKGRAAVEAIQRGEWRPSGIPHAPVELVMETPNIFRLYEQHIGPLSPLIADMLREAEEEYPASWIEAALKIAVENNARNWRYVRAILERWEQEGPDEGKVREDRRDTEKARRRYADWESGS